MAYWPRSRWGITQQSPAPNIVKLIAQYTANGEICENIYHYSSGAAPTVATMNNLIDAFIAWETNHGASWRSTFTGLTRLTAIDLTTSNSPIVDRQVVPVILGNVASPPSPNNVTIAVAWRTGLRGRSFRGRTFHIGMTNNMQSGNQFAPPQLTAFVQNYTLLLALGVTPVFNLGVLSRHQNKQILNPAVWHQATACTVDLNIDSQRRRLTGHNRHR